MLLLVQIVLTVVAWKRGWRWLAVIPLALAFTLGLAIGFDARSEIVMASVAPLLVAVDLLAIAVLGLMGLLGESADTEMFTEAQATR